MQEGQLAGQTASRGGDALSSRSGDEVERRRAVGYHVVVSGLGLGQRGRQVQGGRLANME